MAILYKFTCSCGYQTNACDGKDGCFFVDTLTMTCGRCKELHDVTVRTYERTPLETRGKGTDVAPICPSCGSGDQLTRWKTEGWFRVRPCPKCGKRMSKVGMLALID